MSYRAILLMGPPGVGKGTQGRVMGKIPGFHHLACGDVFRALDLKSDFGKLFMEFSSRGELMPDELTIRQWQDHIEKIKTLGYYQPDEECLILDGIPRNRPQAELLSGSLEVIRVFHLIGPSRETLVDRMQRRALKENRIDDANLEVINRRLDVYEQECRELTAYYGSDCTTEVNADRLPYQVLRDILGEIRI